MKKLSILLLISLAACTAAPENKKANHQSLSNTAVALKLFEYFNKHNWTEMAKLYADSAMFKDPSLGTKAIVQTHSQIIEKYSALQQLFPDIHDEVIAVYQAGEKQVVVEFVSTGTTPDSSKFELPVCTIFTIENGVIVRDNTYYDNSENM